MGIHVRFVSNHEDTRAQGFRRQMPEDARKEGPERTWDVYGSIAQVLRRFPTGLPLSELVERLWAKEHPRLDILTLLTGLEELIEWEFIRIVVWKDGNIIPTSLDGLPKEQAHG